MPTATPRATGYSTSSGTPSMPVGGPSGQSRMVSVAPSTTAVIPTGCPSDERLSGVDRADSFGLGDGGEPRGHRPPAVGESERFVVRSPPGVESATRRRGSRCPGDDRRSGCRRSSTRERDWLGRKAAVERGREHEPLAGLDDDEAHVEVRAESDAVIAHRRHERASGLHVETLDPTLRRSREPPTGEVERVGPGPPHTLRGDGSRGRPADRGRDRSQAS